MTTTADKPQKPLHLTPKGKAQMLMLDAGVNARTALLLTNPDKDKISRVAEHKLRAKYRKYSLTRPSTVKLAERAILDTLQDRVIQHAAQKVTKDGEVVDYTETIAPTYTNKLAAAAVVYDRYEPVTGSEEAGVRLTLIDLSGYRNQISEPDPVDIPVIEVYKRSGTDA